MKYNLNISRLSVVCALCAAMAMPAFSASSVRSLGGAGTYNSASNAAAAKSADASSGNTVSAARAGSMRVNNASGATTGATRSGSSRAATTPRLSIGKYLAGTNSVSGGSSISGSHAGRPGVGGDHSTDVKYLEEFVGYDASGATVPEQVKDITDRLTSVELDVEELAKDLSMVTGVHTVVEYEDGILTVILNGQEPIEYDLNKQFAGLVEVEAMKAEIKALQDALDNLQSATGPLAEYISNVVNETLETYEVPDRSITVEKLADGAVTAEKIDTGTDNAGEMLMLMSNGDGTSTWVSVMVDAEIE